MIRRESAVAVHINCLESPMFAQLIRSKLKGAANEADTFQGTSYLVLCLVMIMF